MKQKIVIKLLPKGKRLYKSYMKKNTPEMLEISLADFANLFGGHFNDTSEEVCEFLEFKG